jgi:hypothetical protein
LDALGDVDMLCPSGAPTRAESGADGLGNAAHTSTVPIMASPMAIEALTSRLGCQRDVRNISFDPLVDSGRDKLPQHAGAPFDFPERTECPDAKSLAPGLGTLQSIRAPRPPLWPVRPSPLAVSVDAFDRQHRFVGGRHATHPRICADHKHYFETAQSS